MSFDLEDTIAAIASAPGGGLRGIIRLSGPNSIRCLARILHNSPPSSDRLPTCRRVSAWLGEALGEVPAALYIWPTARSYTRQPACELHLPGSPPLLEAALALACQAGARLARPGEFTLRAFLAGRIDLTQAEAVLGVIDATSTSALHAALAQLAGGLAEPIARLRGELLDCLAHVEAGLDFADEAIEFITPDALRQQLAAAERDVESLEAKLGNRGEAGQRPRIALIGLPNVGKSSLLNALVEGEAALVSEFAGTTRDFLARRIEVSGRECLLIDTAGVTTEQTAGSIAAQAQAMTHEQTKHADLLLLLLDSTRALESWEREQLAALPAERRLIVWTKCDLAARGSDQLATEGIATSSVTGQGITELRQAIVQRLAKSSDEPGVVASTADRCRESLRLAGEALRRAQFAAGQGEELVAAELWIALEELGSVAGATVTDDLLDRIFTRFCIGK